MIKVSVIIPTFDYPILLENAISSVLNQTLDDIELIIVDDNDSNTDARILTENIINSISNPKINIYYIKHEYNKNGAAARNTGFSVARGKYISLLDSDDEYYLDRLVKCFNIMEKSPDKIAGVYTGCEFRKNGKRYNVYKNVQGGNFLVSTLAGSFRLGTGSNLFIRKKVIDELNGFDEAFLRHQDYEFLVRLFRKYSLQAISEVLVIKNNENINLPDVHKMIDIKFQYLQKYKSIIDDLQKNKQKYIFQCHYVSIAEQAIKTNQFSIANDYYIKAKEQRPLTLKVRLRKIIFTILNSLK